MPCKEVANRWKEKWQTGGREKCHSTAKPSEVVKVWSIRPPSFCVDCVDSVPYLPSSMKIFSQKAPGSFIHKLYGLRSPNSQPSELGNLTRQKLACRLPSPRPLRCQIFRSHHDQSPVGQRVVDLRC